MTATSPGIEYEFRIRVDDRNDAHVRFSLFVGKPDQTGGLAGNLAMRVDEFGEFERLLHPGEDK